MPQGGTVVNADGELAADVLIGNGKVLEVGPPGTLVRVGLLPTSHKHMKSTSEKALIHT